MGSTTAAIQAIGGNGTGSWTVTCKRKDSNKKTDK